MDFKGFKIGDRVSAEQDEIYDGIIVGFMKDSQEALIKGKEDGHDGLWEHYTLVDEHGKDLKNVVDGTRTYWFVYFHSLQKINNGDK